MCMGSLVLHFLTTGTATFINKGPPGIISMYVDDARMVAWNVPECVGISGKYDADHASMLKFGDSQKHKLLNFSKSNSQILIRVISTNIHHFSPSLGSLFHHNPNPRS